MVPIQIEALSFTYPSRTTPTLNNISAEISASDFVLLTGPTGCGKTTLLRTINGLIPHSSAGTITGSVIVNDQKVSDQSISITCQQVGLLFQNPDNQLFCQHIEDEIAFGLENIGLPSGIIRERITQALDQVGLKGFENRQITELSGGEKQRVALASIISMQPDILLLDEPTSHLDPRATRDILKIIKQLNTELGITVVIATHRVKEVEPLCNRIMLMHDGKLILDLPRAFAFQDTNPFQVLGVEIPNSDSTPYYHIPKQVNSAKLDNQLLTLRSVHYKYPNTNTDVVKEINCNISGGEIVAIMGENGSGKTTLLLLMGGILRSTHGDVSIQGVNTKKLKLNHLAGKVGIVFQNPDLILQAESVKDEVAYGPKNLKIKRENLKSTVDDVLSKFMLSDVSYDTPHSLSSGQRQRVAVAGTFSLHPSIFLLDEPTTGQDAKHLNKLMQELCDEIRKENKTLIFATHNIELTQEFADRVMLLSDGEMIFDGNVGSAFSESKILERVGLTY